MLEKAETNSAHDLKILLAGGKPSNHRTVLHYFTPKQSRGEAGRTPKSAQWPHWS
jgi:hypothetical protein